MYQQLSGLHRLLKTLLELNPNGCLFSSYTATQWMVQTVVSIWTLKSFKSHRVERVKEIKDVPEVSAVLVKTYGLWRTLTTVNFPTENWQRSEHHIIPRSGRSLMKWRRSHETQFIHSLFNILSSCFRSMCLVGGDNSKSLRSCLYLFYLMALEHSCGLNKLSFSFI